MPYFSALRFAKKHDGIEGLKKFIKMLDRGESGDKIANEFHISEGRVTQLSKLFGNYNYTPCADVLDLIEQKSEDRLETAKEDLEFVHKQRAKVIPLFDEPKKMEGGNNETHHNDKHYATRSLQRLCGSRLLHSHSNR